MRPRTFLAHEACSGEEDTLLSLLSSCIAACRVCPRKGFRGPVDVSLLDPVHVAHSSRDAASATDSSSTQAPTVNSTGVCAMTAACSEAEVGSGDAALGLEGSAAARSTWDLMLPALPVQYISRVEDLLDVPAGDMYVQPPMHSAAIDSILIVGGTAYLVQITENARQNIGLSFLSVLACLPSHLEVRLLWALPADVWGHSTFNRKAVPQIACLSRPVQTGRARSKKQVRTAEGSMIETHERAEDGTAAKTRVSGVGKQAIKELVDRDVALVERRVAACERQLKMSIPPNHAARRALSQTRMKGRPPACLSTASRIARSAASAVWGLRLVRLPHSLSPFLSQGSSLTYSSFFQGRRWGREAMQIARWLPWRLCVHWD